MSDAALGQVMSDHHVNDERKDMPARSELFGESEAPIRRHTPK